MPNKEDFIREKTYPEVDEVEKRVFYVLVEGRETKSLVTPEGMQAHRTAMLLALLMKHLHDKGQLSDAEITEMLFRTAL